jgi:hypothetical protein
MMILAGLAGSGACEAAKLNPDRIAVCLEGGNEPYLSDSKKIAAAIFVNAHVALDWHYPGYCEKHAAETVVITLSRHTPKTEHAGALAYAQPFEGIHIMVFLDRIQMFREDLTPAILAHVFVHEITHILQGLAHHSESGIMKPHWTAHDYECMRIAPLPFTQDDIDLIHDGCKKRYATLASRAR